MGMGVNAAFFGLRTPPALPSHISVFSHYFNRLDRFTKLATSSVEYTAVAESPSRERHRPPPMEEALAAMGRSGLPVVPAREEPYAWQSRLPGGAHTSPAAPVCSLGMGRSPGRERRHPPALHPSSARCYHAANAPHRSRAAVPPAQCGRDTRARRFWPARRLRLPPRGTDAGSRSQRAGSLQHQRLKTQNLLSWATPSV